MRYSVRRTVTHSLGKELERIDVNELYDTDTYRPEVRHMQGKPMFRYGFVQEDAIAPRPDWAQVKLTRD